MSVMQGLRRWWRRLTRTTPDETQLEHKFQEIFTGPRVYSVWGEAMPRDAILEDLPRAREILMQPLPDGNLAPGPRRGALHLPTDVNTRADSSNITIWYPEQ